MMRRQHVLTVPALLISVNRCHVSLLEVVLAPSDTPRITPQLMITDVPRIDASLRNLAVVALPALAFCAITPGNP